MRPRLVGTPAPGYEVAEVVARPPAVRIAGPRSRVDELESAFTEPVDVSGLETNRVVPDVSIGFDDPVLHVEGISKVTVTAQIGAARAERTFDGLRLEVRGGTAMLTPATVQVVRARPGAAAARHGARSGARLRGRRRSSRARAAAGGRGICTRQHRRRGGTHCCPTRWWRAARPGARAWMKMGDTQR